MKFFSMAMDASELDARISALAQSIEELTVDAQDEATRKKLLGVVEQAQKKLESPMDVIWKLIMSVSTPRINKLSRIDTPSHMHHLQSWY